MHIHELPPRPSAARIFDRDIAPLIESVGSDGFSTGLFGMVHGALDCIHLNAFATSPARRRSLILAENTGASQVARHIGARYLEQYWDMDPVNAQQAPGVRLIESYPGDIGNADYRYHCYTSVRIGARVSICETREQGTVRLNFYREQGFSTAQRDAIIASAGLLMPLLRRHAADQRHAPATAEDFEERLLAIAPDLTTREREVCALIALGVSSEGIGLRLGISLNTVRTYRKRAYTRLRISSHNELLRLACQRPTAN